MPDYDLKDIPILDDIIEETSDDAVSDEEKPEGLPEALAEDLPADLAEESLLEDTLPADALAEELIESENSSDLSSDAQYAADLEDTASTEPESTEPEPTEPEFSEAEFSDQPVYDESSVDDEHYYPETVQTPVQISYQEIYDKSVNLSDNKNLSDSDSNTGVDTPLTETQISIDPIELEAIIASTVKQLLPDLEQQLRFLIQRALEDRLPEGIIKPADNTPNPDIEPDIEPNKEPEIDNT